MENPSLQVDDQTDADFFDKLVDDEFGITESGRGSQEGAESDVSKAFTNLSMGDLHTVLEDSKGEDRSESVILPSIETHEKDILIEEESVSLVPSNSLGFDTVTESSDAANTLDKASDSTMSKSSGSRGTGVKEVQWSAFNTDSADHDDGGFGSYSDFFTELKDGSTDPFREAGDKLKAKSDSNPISSVGKPAADLAMSFSSLENQDSQTYGAFSEQSQQTADGHDLHSSQYWENLYPGWKYDPISGKWYQLDGFDVPETTQETFQDEAPLSGEDVVSNQMSEISYLQQSAQSVVGTMAESCSTGSVSNWNQAPQQSTEYPANIVFDPQYPGWYYDTIAQEWRLLESYTQTNQTASTALEQKIQDKDASSAGFFSDKDHSLYNGFGQNNSQAQGGLCQIGDWAGFAGNYTQQNMWQPGPVAQSGAVSAFTGNQQIGNYSTEHVNNYTDQGFEAIQANHSYDNNNGVTGFQSFASTENLQQFNQTKFDPSQQTHFSPDYPGIQKSINYSQQPVETGNASFSQFSYAPAEGRSSAGRPPHALVTFGFGGKLVVMKNISSSGTSSAYGNQDPVGHSVSLLNLMEVVIDKTDAASSGFGAFSYFHALCQQTFPGPLVGGNVSTKELNKWIDERIANCGSTSMDFRKAELLRLLFSLLKISCQHYGRLRSPFGADPTLQEADGPESAVTKLFASARRNGSQLSEYGAFTHCMQNLPSEGQIRTTAVEVQNLLVSGRRQEALQCAQEGQLWGPALLIAAQLGEKFYVDTAKQMAHRQFVSGSPLRTLCLLIAGQPEDVFSAGNSVNASVSAAINTSHQPMQILPVGMLDDWEENLAIITANRTKNDELVIIHLGDCLWKERGEIAAAHTCYLVAEANFESYSDSARLCLVGADHWKYPRTYASPDAIQRTELYEYSRVLGNSQFILLPFQPYKIIYAHMLAEVGKISDSLRYCQAILKALKNSGRAPEVETWKSLLSSLEERIRTHQQGGYSTNLAPAKLVGKLFNSIDRSIHRMIGAPPPPTPSMSLSNFPSNEYDNHSMAPPKVANSQSTMAMSSLMPSASMEPISDWTADGNRRTMHNRSISEPDFASPKQVDASKEGDARSKASMAGGPSRFGRFGSQLLQKTVGWVSRSRTDREAKLGEKNKFYYDEKLKRWVEEGAAPPAEEAALPPPPTAASFQNGTSDHNINSAFKTQNFPANGGPEAKSPNPMERSSGIPPIPPSNNQFSARGRMGVRSRYVDTFNKGGGAPTNLFQSPSVPAPKPAGAAKFFVPTPTPRPTALGEQTIDATGESFQEVAYNEEPSTSMNKDPSFSSQSSSSSYIQRFPSMNNISPVVNKGMGGLQNGNGSLATRSRAASWSGSYTDMFLSKTTEIKPLGEVLGIPQSTFKPHESSLMSPDSTSLPMNGGSFGDLHEVEL
ncbi:protein transport protein SEC16A homolog [Tasmannia lanceolata]|uniref:protein transport protein SEC16A homolog n=1 Tax=Tasmannia lanceolata TaxID=3420 RepID=UPI0040631B46